MTENMPTEILIDRMGAAHQVFVQERLSIIHAFLAGLSESEQLELIEREGENIESQVAEALAHSPHFTVKKALMDTTGDFSADIAPDVAPLFAWVTIANSDHGGDDGEGEGIGPLQQQAADAINNAGLDFLIAHLDSVVNG